MGSGSAIRALDPKIGYSSVLLNKSKSLVCYRIQAQSDMGWIFVHWQRWDDHYLQPDAWPSYLMLARCSWPYMNMKFLSNFAWLGCLRKLQQVLNRLLLIVFHLNQFLLSLSWGLVIVSVGSALYGWNFLAWIWARLDVSAEAQIFKLNPETCKVFRPKS